MKVHITKAGQESGPASALLVEVDDHGKEGGRIFVDDPQAARTLLTMIGKSDDNATRVEIGLEEFDVDYIKSNGKGKPGREPKGDLKVWNPGENSREKLALNLLGFKVLR